MKPYLTIVILLFSIMLIPVCKKSDPDKTNPKGEKQSHNVDKKRINIDELDLPPRLKQAIKEGKIPKDRIKEFLERMKSDAPVVKIERVGRRPMHAFLILNGIVEPEKKVEVYARLSAYIKQIIKEEGSFVKENDVLAILDDSEIKISYQQAKIQLKQAEITLKDEQENHNRNIELKETELISERDYQTSELNYKKAQLDYENKLENFKNLELQLNYTKITSPVEGFVTERLIEVGDRVNNNQQVYTVEDFTPLLVKVYVPTSDIINVKEGIQTEVSTDVLKGLIFTGSVKLINPRIDVQSGTVKVTVEVFDRTMRLKPGMFVEVKILTIDKPDVLVIPKKSIVYKQNKTYVFIFKQMRAHQREIKIGISEGDYTEIVEGLKEGEMLITVGVESLKDNMQVRVTR